MFINHLAYTASINDGKPEPRLTIPQVWAGLQRKIRAAQEFVPAIISTEVVEEKTDEKKGTPIVVREVVFKEGNRKVREECYEYAPIKVDFLQPDGSTITNTISEGPKGAAAGDILMTYTFEWIHADIDPKDTFKVSVQKKKEHEMAKMAVEKSIESIRRMVLDGTIKA